LQRLLARGRAAESAGRLEEACGHYRVAVASAPSSASAHLHLGVALEALGDTDGAMIAFRSALDAEPDNAYAAYNLGKALLIRGEPERSEALLRTALARKPDFAEAHVVLAGALERRGKLADAIASLRSALERRPGYAGALRNLGVLQAKLGDWPEAARALASAAEADPADADTQLWLGTVRAEEGRREDALGHLRRTLELAPRLADAHVALGNFHAADQRYPDAIACYRAALEIDPRHVTARINLGNALVYIGETDAARGSYDAALAIDPELATARWARAMSRIPVIREAGDDLAAHRRALAEDLRGLDAWFDERRSDSGHTVVGVQQPFWLAYQAEDNRALLEQYGRICSRLMGRWQETAGLHRASVRRPGPIRVGVVSQYFRSHSVWNALVKGWFQGLDPERFELHGFCLGAAVDAETLRARARSARFVQGPLTLRAWSEAILEAQPDVLIFPEIGMDPMTVKLASQRLAPLQAASWGHPETTGLPTIDVYFSAAGLEPLDAHAHYTERLVALPNLGCYLEPSEHPVLDRDLAQWGLSADRPLLLCPGTPFKYAPEQDRLYVEIAGRVGPCQLCFFICGNPALSEKLRHRLAHAFTQAGLDFDRHVRFIPWLAPPEFYALMRRADAMLDTVGFSGFNTALQAVECGLPVVGYEGRFMRGRLASGILRHLGLDELVATDEAGFVDLAVALTADAGLRTRLRRQTESARHRLYRDTAPIRALEEFLQHSAGG
jgi:protein O-GlcNAc transferase